MVKQVELVPSAKKKKKKKDEFVEEYTPYFSLTCVLLAPSRSRYLLSPSILKGTSSCSTPSTSSTSSPPQVSSTRSRRPYLARHAA